MSSGEGAGGGQLGRAECVYLPLYPAGSVFQAVDGVVRIGDNRRKGLEGFQDVFAACGVDEVGQRAAVAAGFRLEVLGVAPDELVEHGVDGEAQGRLVAPGGEELAPECLDGVRRRFGLPEGEFEEEPLGFAALDEAPDTLRDVVLPDLLVFVGLGGAIACQHGDGGIDVGPGLYLGEGFLLFFGGRFCSRFGQAPLDGFGDAVGGQANE